MGGCRCVYRKCQNTTNQCPELHYFHFPVRDPPRCEQWITNARKPSFRQLDKSKLRNKVICSMHFEKKCFINENHDRLIHNAVPTLGFEDDDENRPNMQNPLSLGSTDNIDIMLIPLNEDNTKFTLPDVGFSGMSYTLCNDMLIPSNKLNLINRTDTRPSTIRNDPRTANVKPIIKKIKTNFPLRHAYTISSASINESGKTGKLNTVTPLFPKQRTEAELINGKNISTYSVSTVNGDLSLEPSTNSDMNNLRVDKIMHDYHTDPSLLNDTNDQMLDNISLHLKSNNEYTISVEPNTVSDTNSKTSHFMNIDEMSQDSTKNSTSDALTMEISEENSEIIENELNVAPKKEYIRMIKMHSKQIKQLKNLVQKQSKINKMILQRKRMPSLKQRKLSKLELLDLLKPFLKPSLVAILKFELLSSDDVVLNDNEEKFITDLYTENPECYNLLKNKWEWNLPSSERAEEQKTE